jgi:fructan beta-fructosidase
VDYGNTTGFQQNVDTPPIVAMFTHSGASQQQSIAYSLNKARDYVKYEGNPVIPNTNLRDFRDPKVVRYSQDTWVMVLAAGNKVMFYSSPDLKTWTYLSEFGADPPQGSHSGVWECPDLLKMEYNGFTYWVLLVSTSGGGPNGGSFTQYFIGLFNGREFQSSQSEARWMDWGEDNYASVSFSNEPRGRQIVIGWMTNLAYAENIPTGNFRGQMTLPRTLSLENVGGHLSLKSALVEEFDNLRIPSQEYQLGMKRIEPNGYWNVSEELGFKSGLVEVDLAFNIAGIRGVSSIAICFVNRLRQELCVGYDHERPVDHEIFVNRERTGDLGAISGNFVGRATSGRVLPDNILTFKIVMDLTAVELFVDGGLTVMTSMFFPDEPLDALEIRHHALTTDDSEVLLINGRVQGLRSIYDC